MDLETTELKEDACYVALTHDYLNVNSVMDRVRSPQAGAIVMFAGQSVTLHRLTISQGNHY